MTSNHQRIIIINISNKIVRVKNQFQFPNINNNQQRKNIRNKKKKGKKEKRNIPEIRVDNKWMMGW